MYVWHKRYRLGEHGYKLACLLLEQSSNIKVEISGYRPTFAVTETTRTNHWATGLTFRLEKLVSKSNTFELMKISQKIWCQPISARKWTSIKQWLAKTELEIFEVSEFSIMALILKSKTRKTRKYLQHL